MAAGPDRVFVVSPDGVLAFSPLLRRWEGPFLPPVAGRPRAGHGRDDRSAGQQPLALGVRRMGPFPAGRAGLGAGRGGRPAARLRVRSRRPVRGAPLPDLDRVVQGAAGRAGSRSQPRLPSGPSRPATVAQALASNPALGGAASAFLLDPSLQNARLTSAARSFDNLGWYLGTDGVGALFVADGMVVPQRLHFGLPGPVVGAIYAVPGGIWVLTDRVETGQSALTFVASDLTEFRVFSGPAATGLPYHQRTPVDRRRQRIVGGDGRRRAPVRHRGSLAVPPVRRARRASRSPGGRRSRPAGESSWQPPRADWPGSPTRLAPSRSRRITPARSGPWPSGPDTAWIGISTGPRGAATRRARAHLPAGVEESAVVRDGRSTTSPGWATRSWGSRAISCSGGCPARVAGSWVRRSRASSARCAGWSPTATDSGWRAISASGGRGWSARRSGR